MIDAFDSMGLLGVIFSLYAYARVQLRREYAKNIGYSLANLLGAGLLAVSLVNKWNLASFTGNVVWALFSLFGIYRCVKYMRRNNVQAERKRASAVDPLGR